MIAEYTTNIDELFAKKTCETFLAAARNIMKKDLHDIKQVGTVRFKIVIIIYSMNKTFLTVGNANYNKGTNLYKNGIKLFKILVW